MIGRLIWVATVISVATYLFWSFFPKGAFYIGNSLFILILSIIIFIQNRKLFISFFLLCIATNNLLDELFFAPTKLGVNEIIFAIIIPIIYYARKNNKLRILHFFN
jgi:hypothetical protein